MSNLESNKIQFSQKVVSDLPLLDSLLKNPDVKMGYLGKKGKGIIAAKNFAKGETLKEITPYGFADLETMIQFEKKYQNENEDLDLKAKKILDDVIQIDNELYLIGKPECEFIINHSCNPNTAFVQYQDKGEIKFAFKTLKPIKKGEEICFDYSTVIGDEFILECSCGDKECRGFAGRPAVHSNEERKKILARYPEGWLLPYVEKELKAPFSEKKINYLDEPCPETTIYSFEGLKKRKTFDAKMRNMKELIERCPNFHPKFKDMMMKYIKNEY